MNLFKKLSLTAVAAISLAGVGATSLTGFTTTVQAAPSQDSLQTQISDLNKEVAKLNSKVSAKQREIDDINNQVDKIQKGIAKTKKQIGAAKDELKDRKEILKNQLVELQKQSNSTVSGNIYIDYILNSNNFSDFIGRAMAINKISSANKAAIDDVNKAKDKLDALAEKQADKQNEITSQKSKAEVEMKELNASKQKALDSQKKLQVEMWKNKEALESQSKQDSETTQNLVANQSFAGSSSLISNTSRFIGVPYVWGGSTPAGFDCSGLVQYAANMAGISLPRTSQAQSTVGTYVPVSQLQAGDLVFWGGVGSAYHVGVYIGGGQFIHAPQPGENVKVGSSAYFAPSFGRRL